MPPPSPQLHICTCPPLFPFSLCTIHALLLTTASYMYMPSSLSFSLCTVQAPSPQLPMYMPSSLSFSLCTCPPLTTASYVHNLLFFLFSLYMPPPSPQFHMYITSSFSFSLCTCPPSLQLHMFITSSLSFSLCTCPPHQSFICT